MATANTFGTPDNSVGTLNGFFKETYKKRVTLLYYRITELQNYRIRLL